MGIGVEPRMGNQLSVSILSALGDGSARPVQQVPAKALSSINSVSIQAHGPQALLPPSIPEPVPSITSGDPIKVTTDQPETAKQELDLPPSDSEPQKPVSARTGSKTEPKGQAPGSKKAEIKQETLQFEPVSRGRFEKSEPTIIDGQDLDVPTFLRKNVKFR
jgi:cell division protein FtsZ